MSLVVLGDETADQRLHLDIEPDGGLIEEQDLRAVEERGAQLTSHPLAQGEVAGRLIEELAEIEQLNQLVEGLPVLWAWDVEQRAVELEGLGGGEVPEELLLLAHHQGDGAEQGVASVLRTVPQHLHSTRGGMEQPGEHLQRGGFSGAVRAQEPHAFTRFHLKRHLVYRHHLSVLSPEQGSQRRRQPGLAHRHSVHLGELLDSNQLPPPSLPYRLSPETSADLQNDDIVIISQFP